MRGKRLTQAEFIDRSSAIHNNKYDYSLVEYLNTHTKVKIICSSHGEFEQIAMDHIKGMGCYACSGKQRHSQEKFLLKIQKIILRPV